jgi:hypothetical protein
VPLISKQTIQEKVLEKYGYPPVLIEVISRFSECVLSLFEDSDPGVLLIGSASRGELSWLNEAGNIQLFSDIEFLVSVTKKNSKKERMFQELISKLEAEYDLGEIFHIDYTIIKWNKLPGLDKKFFIFECQQCGIDFGERSVRNELPIVSRSNLNWRELNEILLHRLNSILHILPLSFFDKKMTEKEENNLALSLAKNSLDITTWLHPYEAEKLVSGFTSRLSAWDEDFIEQSKLGRYFSLDDIKYLKRCLALRGAPNKKVEAVVMLNQTLLLYKKSISYCKAMNSIDASASISAVLPSVKLFDEYRLRQRISQFVSMLVNFNKVGIAKMFRNSIGIRRGIAINVCHYMLLAANDYINNNDRCWSNLNHAQLELSKLVLNVDIKSNDFITSWLRLRVKFKKYQDISHNY